ncbi:UNKNOWN [Stylonychia lemnae]|uniref:Uncharacterized protein n=1 Tax=Stylonychia lemnae TaxID=5949 RepID=A0A077ZW13_STYLE|nr:UNKNOWN [Stylonychia lemnae]|eukprot:CDW72631.1 UNKNOWN [Stylonychia lemnae]
MFVRIAFTDTVLCNCNQMNDGIFSYLRCTFKQDSSKPDNVFLDDIKACLDGFIDIKTGKCVTNCGIGQYGQVSYGMRGMIEKTVCLDWVLPISYKLRQKNWNLQIKVRVF